MVDVIQPKLYANIWVKKMRICNWKWLSLKLCRRYTQIRILPNRTFTKFPKNPPQIGFLWTWFWKPSLSQRDPNFQLSWRLFWGILLCCLPFPPPFFDGLVSSPWLIQCVIHGSYHTWFLWNQGCYVIYYLYNQQISKSF